MKPAPHQKVSVSEKKPIRFPRPNPHALIIVHWSQSGKLPVTAVFTHGHFLRLCLLFWGVSGPESPETVGGTDSEERLLAWKLNHTPRSPETGTALFFQGKKQPSYYSSQGWIDAATVYLIHICLLAEHMSLSELKITLSLSASGSANELSISIWLKGQFTHKWIFCHHILHLLLFQTCTLRDLKIQKKLKFPYTSFTAFQTVLKSHNSFLWRTDPIIHWKSSPLLQLSKCILHSAYLIWRIKAMVQHIKNTKMNNILNLQRRWRK